MTVEQKIKKAKAEYIKKWKSENREKVRKYMQEWRKRNKDKVKEYQRNYWLRKYEQGANNG